MILFVISAMMAAHADSVKPVQDKSQRDSAISLSATLIPLNHQDAAITTVGSLHYLGGLKITSSNRQFGGISSFVVSPDGGQILGVSDSSRWFVADMIYNNKNHLIDIKNAHMAPIKNLDGAQKSNALDAEAITAVDGAGFVVSFESPHTLRYFQASRPFEYNSLFSAVAQKVNFAPELPRTYASLPGNLGIEALTTLSDGRMLAFSEETTTNREIEQAKGWIIGHGKIESLRYETSSSYRPTDMATLPNGDILVLERHFSLAKGMAARLTRLPAMSIKAGQSVKGKIIADLAFPFNLDNMEALAVRQNDRGETIIYIMSDNNYNRLQRNILMMFKMDTPIKKAAEKINGLNRILAGSN
ncbi:MAG: esterase-like activity of phytase family protein [Emcibacter sp.]|nr:esterase-like activity of phytase family protein [Emcibacter sp.]